MKINTHILEEQTKNEIKKLDSEINILKENNSQYKKDLSELKEENKKLLQNNNKLTKTIETFNKIQAPKITYLDSEIITINSINFILDYLKENDKSFNYKEIKLLFRGSRDGDRTKTCHELCDNKQNVLIIIQSDTGYIFGGYSKIGFKCNNKCDEWKLDNNCFLFSIDLKKIYSVIKGRGVICHIKETFGLCFFGGLGFYDNFMNTNDNKIHPTIKEYFIGLKEDYEMNGGQDNYKCKELEVFQFS